MSSTVIAKSGAFSACIGENGNYFFHDQLRNVIIPTTEEQVKEWCKKTFHNEYVFEQLANFFPDDPDFQIEKLEFYAPRWIANEYRDFRDRNCVTDDSAFYRMVEDEKELRRKHLEEIAKHPEDYEDEED